MNRSSVSAYLVQKGQKNGFHLEEGKSVLIGRGNDVAIQIDDKRCSRHHAEITFLYNKVENSGKFLLCSKGKNPVIVMRNSPQHENNSAELLKMDATNCILYDGDSFSLIPNEDHIFSVTIKQIHTDDKPSPLPKIIVLGKRKEDDMNDNHNNNNNKSKNHQLQHQDSDDGSILMTASKFDHSKSLSPSKSHSNNNKNESPKIVSPIKSPIKANANQDENKHHLSPSPNKKQNEGSHSPSSPSRKSYFDFTRKIPPKKGQIPVPEGAKNCLKGKVFLVTGVMESLERDEVTSLIKKYGGKVVTGITKTLTHAVVGLEPGPKKLQEFKSLPEVTIIDESQLFEIIKTNKAPEVVFPDACDAVASPPAKSPKKGNNSSPSGAATDKKDWTPRISCKYGEGCYRKNQDHLDKFSHPGDKDYVVSVQSDKG